MTKRVPKAATPRVPASRPRRGVAPDAPAKPPESPMPTIPIRDPDAAEAPDVLAPDLPTPEPDVPPSAAAPVSDEYPRWLYHTSGDRRIVHTAADAAALGDGWGPTPPKE